MQKAIGAAAALAVRHAHAIAAARMTAEGVVRAVTADTVVVRGGAPVGPAQGLYTRGSLLGVQITDMSGYGP